MCTIVILSGVSDDFPVVVAANRDEFYHRATRPPARLEGMDAVAGIDLERGGTWMGATAAGFFAGLTNQRTFAAPDPGRRSRGEVVLECLALGDRAAVRDHLRRLEAGAYNPFNLIAGDASGLDCAYVRDTGVELVAVPAGVSVLSNDVLDSPALPKVDRARALLGDDLGELEWPALVARLHRVLGDHDKAPVTAARGVMDAALLTELGALCVHTPLYGTRSFTACALAPQRVAHYAFADGPTCRSTPAEITGLLYSSG